MLGYLLLGPTLVAILLPRSGPLTENSFVLLGVLLLYAAAAWATVAFRGIFPTPPQVLKPVLAVFVWLVVFGVVAWILQRLLATPGSALPPGAVAVTWLLPLAGCPAP